MAYVSRLTEKVPTTVRAIELNKIGKRTNEESAIFSRQRCAMHNKRLYTRVNCNRACQLHWNGLSYPAIIKNTSMVSMGLHFDGSHPDVKLGDFCLIYVNDNNVSYPYQVVRVNTYDVAVGIIDRHKHS